MPGVKNCTIVLLGVNMFVAIIIAFATVNQVNISSRDFPKEMPLSIDEQNNEDIIRAIKEYARELELSRDLPVCPVTEDQYWLACA